MTDKNHRQRLYGKPASVDEISREVARLLLGDTRRSLAPSNPTDICRTLSWNSRDTFYKYKEEAIQRGYLQLDQNGQAIVPKKTADQIFRAFCVDNKLANTPLGSQWVENMKHRKGGKPIASWKSRLTNFSNWLNTLQINESAVLTDLPTTDKYAQNFLDLYETGKAKIQYRKDKNFGADADISKVAYVYAQAYRDFMNFHGLPYPKNYGGVSSQKVVGHGQYPDVKLTDDQLVKAQDWFIKNYSVDSDELRFWLMGVESCGRHSAVFPMTLDYEIAPTPKGATGTCYIFKVFESKTVNSRGAGKWDKYVLNPVLQKSIDELKSRDVNRLNEENLTKKNLDMKIREAFLGVYKHLGVMTVHDSYFPLHWFHALRHVGAHMWLRKTGYNHSVVSEVGGWLTVQELVDSYGKIPHDMMLQKIFGN